MGMQAAFAKPPRASNFTSDHTVFVPNVSVEAALDKLGSRECLEQVARLSPAVDSFELGETARIQLPNSKTSLKDCSILAEAATSSQGPERTLFTMHESFKVLFINNEINIVGCQTVDQDAATVLYESYSQNQNIWIWKLRQIRKADRAATSGVEVIEHIDGVCSPWMRWIVEREARKAHQGHMNDFVKLFA